MTSSLENNAAIVLRDVGKDYGTVRAVDGVNLEVGYGELFGLIGHNGAGKSTLFRMMLGLIPVSEGEIHVAGASLRTAAFRAARRRIGYLPENLALYDNLSGLETLRFFARLKGAPTGDCEALLARVGLQGATAKPVRAYSRACGSGSVLPRPCLARRACSFSMSPPTVWTRRPSTTSTPCCSGCANRASRS